jgi:hypothetical protein
MSGYPARHFSFGNPEGPTSSDLPLLLRRLADQIEADGIKSEDILDVTISGAEVTEHGSWWQASVYWSEGNGEPPQRA